MKRRDFYFWGGILFLLLQVVAITRNVFSSYLYFFWFCDFVPLVYAIVFFLKKDQAIKGMVNIGLFPQVIYLFSFVIKIAFGVSIVNEMDVLFARSAFLIFATVLFHSATIFAFFFTYKRAPNMKTLYYSFFWLVAIFVVTSLFTKPEDSINYVFIVSNFLGIDNLSFLWIPLTFLLVILPTQGLQYLVSRYFKRESRKKAEV